MQSRGTIHRAPLFFANSSRSLTPLFSWSHSSLAISIPASLPLQLPHMYLTISTTHTPATDLGYLLHKRPGKLHPVELTFGPALLQAVPPIELTSPT